MNDKRVIVAGAVGLGLLSIYFLTRKSEPVKEPPPPPPPPPAITQKGFFDQPSNGSNGPSPPPIPSPKAKEPETTDKPKECVPVKEEAKDEAEVTGSKDPVQGVKSNPTPVPDPLAAAPAVPVPMDDSASSGSPVEVVDFASLQPAEKQIRSVQEAASPQAEAVKHSAFFGNVHYDLQEMELFAFLSQACGLRVAGVKIVRKDNTRAFAFVDFVSAEDLEAAITMSGMEIRGRSVSIQAANSNNNNAGRGRGRGGRGEGGRGRGGRNNGRGRANNRPRNG